MATLWAWTPDREVRRCVTKSGLPANGQAAPSPHRQPVVRETCHVHPLLPSRARRRCAQLLTGRRLAMSVLAARQSFDLSPGIRAAILTSGVAISAVSTYALGRAALGIAPTPPEAKELAVV